MYLLFFEANVRLTSPASSAPHLSSPPPLSPTIPATRTRARTVASAKTTTTANALAFAQTALPVNSVKLQSIRA